MAQELLWVSNRTIGFVSNGSGAINNAGFHSRDWWQTKVNAVGTAAARAAAMGTNDAPLVLAAGYDFYGDSAFEGYVVGADNVMDDVEVGMGVFLINTAGDPPDITSDWYKIAWVGNHASVTFGGVGNNAIRIDTIANTGDAAASVVTKIGGASDKLFAAGGSHFLNLDATWRKVAIYTNIPTETIDESAAMVGGVLADNTGVDVIWYKVTPGDAGGQDDVVAAKGDVEQTYYGDAHDAACYMNSIASSYWHNPLAEWGVVDGDGGAYHLVKLDNDHNISFEGFHFTNVAISTRDLFSITNNPTNIYWGNSIFSAARGAIGISSVYRAILNECYSDDSVVRNHFAAISIGGVVRNCILKLADTKEGIEVQYGTRVDNCVFINGATGVKVTGWGGSVTNSTFYNQTAYAVYVNHATATFYVTSNIFETAAVDVPAVLIANVSKGLLNRNVAFCAAGDFTIDPFVDSNNVGGQADFSIAGPNDLIDVDPELADPANYDFRLKASSPAWNKGKPSQSGGYSTPGAWNRINLARTKP